MKKIFLFLLLSFSAFEMNAQVNGYEILKNNYDRLRSKDKKDSALLIAKQMNVWALRNEGDTGIHYSISCLEIGNSFFSLEYL